jgi:hypothetical protein
MNARPEVPTGTIWKYALKPDSVTVHEIPKGAKPLTVGADPTGRLSVWFMVDPTQPKEKRAIIMVGTGHPLPLEAAPDYIGTFVIGDFVNHVFAPVMVDH